MASRDPAKSRANTLAIKIWQTTQSNATKTENLEHDFEELSTDTTESLDGLVKRTTQELGSTRPKAVGFKETTSQGKKHFIKGMSAGSGCSFPQGVRGSLWLVVSSLKEGLIATNGQSRR